jgi:4-amino-4-deoxy-L-arabinose transferase-like glycosyltransferase
MTTFRDFVSRSRGWLLGHTRTALAVVFVVALAARVAATFVVAAHDPVIDGDMISYDAFATRIVAGGWWNEPVSYREPGYPMLVAVVYALTDHSVTAARYVNALLGALTCLAVYALGRRVFGAMVGLMAAGWFSVYFHSVHYSPYLLRESLVTLLAVVFWVFLFDAARGARRTRSAVFAAIGYVLLVHTDARFLFHAPFVLLYLLLAGGGWRRALRPSLVLCAVVIVGMIPWQLRNYMAYHRVVVVNTRTLVIEVPWVDYTQLETPKHLQPKAPDTREGVRRLHGARRALYDLAEFYRVFRFRGEVRNNSNVWERPWSSFHNWSSILMYGTLIPFFIYGYWVILRRRMTGAYVLVLPVLAHTILHVLEWGRYRYRMPIEPLLIIVAFFGVSLLWNRFVARGGVAEGTS